MASNETGEGTILFCDICSKRFTTVSNKNKHTRNMHGIELAMSMKIQCQEGKCQLNFGTIEELRKHLKDEHGHSFSIEVKSFLSENEFLEWKEDIEKEGNFQFVKKKGDKRRGNILQQYYHCNRSGIYKSQSSGKRMAKETCKIGHHCTSTMSVTIHNSGKVDVQCVKEHYGHEMQLKHLRLPKPFRTKVAGQINNGVSFHRILDFVRCSIDETYNRTHLLTRVDIRNIQRAFGLKGVERHPSDSTSVLLMFKAYEELADLNPILYYKLQGEEPCDQGTDILKSEDIFIVIMNPLQCSMFKKYGQKLICVDSTHGTNGYDFHLTTVMVVDEFGEGFPTAWLICNREDELVLTKFFEIVKSKVGETQTLWFMTDDADQYYNAWISVFGTGPIKLLCAWHVDRAWRQKLKIISDKEVQCESYYKLCVLREEPNEQKFLHLLKQVQEDFQENEATKQFGLYFRSNYSNRPSQWAVCYRQGSGVNTNMYLESFHRTLKHVYMKGKVNKRLDKCIHILLNIIRDKGIERIIKLEKGKVTSRLMEIEKRHRASMTLDLSLVSKVEENSYLVKSSTEAAEYTVSLNRPNSCNAECKLTCKVCAICIHCCHCSCPDFIIKGVICKHIHLTARAYPNTQNSLPYETSIEANIDEGTEEQNSCNINNTLKHVREQQADSGSLQHQKNRGANLLMEISALMSLCHDPSKVKQANNMLQSVKNLLQIEKETSVMEVCCSAPANKCIERQREFFSTKIKPNKSKFRLAKPNFHQKSKVVSNLLGEYSGTSLSCDLNDHDYAKESSTEVPTESSKLSCSFPLSEQELEILQFVTAETTISQKFPIEESKIITVPESVNDKILDLDLTKIRKFLTEDAWLAVNSLLDAKRLLWKCELCDVTTTMQNMISCEKCDKWFHFDCVGINIVPDGEWICDKCNHLKTGQ